MSKTKLNIVILLLVISPVPVGFLSGVGQPSESISGLAALGGIVFGIPAIAIIGILTSIIVRKSPNANKFTIVGYAVPAVVVCSLMLLSYINAAQI